MATEPTSEERALEAALRIDHLKKERVSALLYAVLCGAAGVGWLLVFWPATFGPIRMQMRWFGSPTLGWVWIVGGALLLLVAALGFVRRFVRATSEIVRLRATTR